MSDRTDPRIDLLIYAHDGRGFGHVSRSVAIGAAFRRLYPARRVLLLTGFKQTQSLIGPVPLDWIKLPAYAKTLVDGRPQSQTGAANLAKSHLVQSRTRLIRSIVNEYRPRCVLVDHQPQGKSRELLPAIDASESTNWILGMRGIIGQVDEVWSQTAISVFRSHYNGLLWYGDQRILGRQVTDHLAAVFENAPIPVGYVSRLRELAHWMPPPPDHTVYAGTIAVPWQSAADGRLIDHLYEVLESIGGRYGLWRLFLEDHHERFNRLDHCRAQRPGIEYIQAVASSRMAVVYGGYNSLTDILATGIPAVVLLRHVHDGEQQAHIGKLIASSPASLIPLEENQVSTMSLKRAILNRLTEGRAHSASIDLNGAEKAAKRLFNHMHSSDNEST